MPEASPLTFVHVARMLRSSKRNVGDSFQIGSILFLQPGPGLGSVKVQFFYLHFSVAINFPAPIHVLWLNKYPPLKPQPSPLLSADLPTSSYFTLSCKRFTVHLK